MFLFLKVLIQPTIALKENAPPLQPPASPSRVNFLD